jgi:DNA-binding NtrC family response regulator
MSITQSGGGARRQKSQPQDWLVAAAKLGIPRSTLESKIRSLKIDKNRFKIADPAKIA